MIGWKNEGLNIPLVGYCYISLISKGEELGRPDFLWSEISDRSWALITISSGI